MPNITQLLKTSSPTFGHDDPVKKKPRFLTKPDRRHELYKQHESAAVVMETFKVCSISVQGGDLGYSLHSWFADVILFKAPVCWMVKYIYVVHQWAICSASRMHMFQKCQRATINPSTISLGSGTASQTSVLLSLEFSKPGMEQARLLFFHLL